MPVVYLAPTRQAIENDVNVGYNEEYKPLGCAGP